MIGKKRESVPLRVDEDLKIRGLRIAGKKQLPGLSTLYRQYVQDGIDRDETALGLPPLSQQEIDRIVASLSEAKREKNKRKPKP